MPLFVKRLFRLLLILFPLVIFFSAPALCQVNNKEAKKEKRISGIFTIGPDGETYMFFPDLAAKFRVGQIVKGEVPDKVIAAMAEVSEIQKSVFLAAQAWEWCIKAKKDAAKGLISKATADLACALSDKYAALAEIAWASEFVARNPNGEVVENAQDVLSEEQSKYQAAVENEAGALAAGGQLAQLEAYEEVERRIVAPVTPIQEEIEPQLRGLPPIDLLDTGEATGALPGT